MLAAGEAAVGTQLQALRKAKDYRGFLAAAAAGLRNYGGVRFPDCVVDVPEQDTPAAVTVTFEFVSVQPSTGDAASEATEFAWEGITSCHRWVGRGAELPLWGR